MMPDSAKILKFPQRGCSAPLPEEARRIADRYLCTPQSERAEHFVEECLSLPDNVFEICNSLMSQSNLSPVTVSEEAVALYDWLRKTNREIGSFDEPAYFLGESALIAGSTLRLLGKREEADLWFDRAEAGFRCTINAGPSLARVACERLSLHYDMRRYERVFELGPSLIESFRKSGMQRQALKCRLLLALSLKDSGRLDEAQRQLQELKQDVAIRTEETLHGVVLAHLGELLATAGHSAEAVAQYREALALEGSSSQPLTAAHLKVAIAEGLKQQGQLAAAVQSYRGAVADYASLGMATWVAYIRILVAETLIALSRYREADLELLMALPTIEEQKMVPEGFAAVALLRESVRLRKTDPNALRELREHLQTRS
jgi:tetratricopeptide (TPR) repeat protein